MEDHSTFYISLCNGLQGSYVKVQAPSEAAVRLYATEYMGKIWYNIYTEAYFYEILRRRYPKATKVINLNKPIVLTSDGKYKEVLNA